MLRIGAAVGCFGSMMLVAGCLTVAQGIGNSGSFWPGAFAGNFGRFSSLAGIRTLAADALGRDRLSESTILLWVLRSTELHWQSGPSGMSHCHCHRDPSGPGTFCCAHCPRCRRVRARGPERTVTSRARDSAHPSRDSGGGLKSTFHYGESCWAPPP